MYVLQVKGGKENVVKQSLQNAGYRAFVPIENRVIRSGGNWNEKEYVLFPNYVFIETDYNAENFYRITNMEYVTCFLGNRYTPSSLTFIEVEWINILSGNDKPLQATKVRFDKNNDPHIVEGILENFKSRVKAFNKRQKKATFEISICNELKEITLSIDVIDENANQETSED